MFCSTLALVAIVMGPLAASVGSPADFMRVLDEMERAYARVDHYTATFLMQERIDGELETPQLIALKFKKPFRVYMHWIEGPNKGRKALYPAAPNSDKLLVRVPIFLGPITLRLDPHGSLAMKGRRHPITDIGIGRLLDLITENIRRGFSKGKLRVEDRGGHPMFDRPAHRYWIDSPADLSTGYAGMSAIIDVDREHRLPIYAEIFDRENQLIERYGYLNLQLNPGLTDADFDPKHPEYGF